MQKRGKAQSRSCSIVVVQRLVEPEVVGSNPIGSVQKGEVCKED